MAQGAPLKNEYWRLRKDMSKDGRKISVEDFEKKCQEYIDRCVTEKLNEIDYRGRDLTEVEIPKMICMSMWGCCHYLGITTTTWQELRKDKKYSTIINKVEDLFKSYNIEGSSAGFLNPNIIARLAGLKEKTETAIITEQPLFPE